MPTLPPVPPATPFPFRPEGESKTVQDVSLRVRDAAARDGRRREPATGWPGVDLTDPLLRLAGAAFLGFALGTIIHGRTAPEEPPAPRRRRRRPEPMTSYRSPRPTEERRSSIRFR